MMVMDVANQSKRVTVGHVMDVTRVENCQVHHHQQYQSGQNVESLNHVMFYISRSILKL